MQTPATSETPIFDALGGEQRVREMNTDYLLDRHTLLKAMTAAARRPTKLPNARQRRAIAKQNGWL